MILFGLTARYPGAQRWGFWGTSSNLRIRAAHYTRAGSFRPLHDLGETLGSVIANEDIGMKHGYLTSSHEDLLLRSNLHQKAQASNRSWTDEHPAPRLRNLHPVAASLLLLYELRAFCVA